MRLVAEIGSCDGKLLYAQRVLAQLAGISSEHDVSIEVKPQFYTADRLVTRDAPRYDRLGGKWRTQHAAFQHQLTHDEWGEVVAAATEHNLYLFPSVFDHEAIEMAMGLGCSTLKIASGDITYHDLIRHAAQAGPSELILSTGASTLDEIDAAVEVVASVGRPEMRLILLACTLSYPARDANLGRILLLRQRYEPIGALVGYSDHTSRPETPVGAAALGAAMWEFHFTATPHFGGDHDFAYDRLSVNRVLSTMRRAFDPGFLGVMAPSEEESAARTGARRSLVAAVDIPLGTRLTRDMVAVLRPGTGIAPYDIDKVVAGGAFKGLMAQIDITAGTVISWSMVGNVGGTLSVS